MRRGTPDLVLDTVWQPSFEVLILDSGQDESSKDLCEWENLEKLVSWRVPVRGSSVVT